MTLQEIFTKVVTHLLAQGRRSYGAMPFAVSLTEACSEGCLYRGPDGTKCAVGCLIPDELYQERLENVVVSDLKLIRVLQQAGVLAADAGDYQLQLELLMQLQAIHDSTRPEEWRDALYRCARTFGLTMPETK